MFNIKNSVIVPYSTEQMFVLVNDISSYSHFIPGCVRSSVLSGDSFKLIAKMDITGFGVSHSLVTQNIMVKNHSIMVNLVHGPVKSLFGVWRFIYLNHCMTNVKCDFSCEFDSMFLERMFGCVIKRIVADIVDSFVFRADAIYG